MTFNRRNFLVSFVASVIAAACGGGTWSDVYIPMPSVLRSDLNYCYYMSLPGQMQATADHTNLLWHAQFYSPADLANELLGHTHKVVLDCAPQLFVSTSANLRSLSPTAEADLRAFFTDLRSRNLLARIAYLTPMDEPNLFCNSASDLVVSMTILRRVVVDYPELADVKYVCIYGLKAENLYGLDQFDIVGIDNYDQKSDTLIHGAHADLMKVLLPNQKVMVIPGAAYGQDPDSFIAYAHSEPKCWGVVPFIWCHVPASADKEGWVGLEKQDATAQSRWRAAGLLTLNRNSPV